MRKERHDPKGSRDYVFRSLRRLTSAFLAISGPLLCTAVGADSTIDAGPESKPRSLQSAANRPFSVGYSLDYSRQLVAGGDVECVPGYGGDVLFGHLNERGDVSRESICWLAHLDTPGHIHWAVRLGNETGSSASDMTCRQDAIYALLHTGPNCASIGKFAAESMMPIKVVQFSGATLLNQALFQLHREPSLPIAVSVIQDGGDTVALTIISQDLEIALNESYSIPAFATGSRDPFGRSSRCGVFRIPDGSGYDLVITDVHQASASSTTRKTRLGIIRIGLDGTLKWSRLYSFNVGEDGPLSARIATDGAFLAATSIGARSGKSFLVKIAPDGSEAWAKVFDAPNTTFNDFRGDGTPYRFIHPSLKATGAVVSHGQLQAIVLALDYATGGILYQTQFPTNFSGGGGLSDQNDNSIYVSTLGLQLAKGGMKTNVSICRFDHQLRLLAAKEIIGAQSRFALLTCGPHGVNVLSYDFLHPFRGVGSAVNDNLESIDFSCPWIRQLNMVMKQSSYSSADAECKEEPFVVAIANGTATIQPDTFNLFHLALKLEKGTDLSIQPEPVQPDPAPAQKYSDDSLRPLGDPKPVAYRATNEIVDKSNGALMDTRPLSSDQTQRIGSNISLQAENQLNEVYIQLRHTLTPAEKEALKQEELDWLKKRERFLSGDPQWIELTEARIRQLKSRLSGVSEAPASQQTEKSDAASSDGQFVVVESEPSGSGSGREIELRTTGGETLATLYSGAQLGFRAHWSEDSKHLIVIVLNRFNGRRNDTLAVAEKVYGKWQSVGYSMLTQGSEISFLNWLSPDTARLQSGSLVVTMPFPKPTKFVFQLGRFSDLTLETEPGSEKVTFETGDKRGSATVFASPVKLAGGMSYVSPGGTRFQLEKLDPPVINDANRKINSGDWKVIVSGSGDEYLSLKEKIGEPSFGDTGKTEYYGAIELEAEGK